MICERDVGLFSLIQQVIANVPWALAERRVPIACFGDGTCYWTPNGYHGRDTVWEYYFEPVIAEFPVSRLPSSVRDAVAATRPNPATIGYAHPSGAWVSNHFGDHRSLNGRALNIPYLWDDPDAAVRAIASGIISRHVRPRDYIQEKVESFLRNELGGGPFIGVHIRGTDAVSPQEKRPHRQGSLVLSRYVRAIRTLLRRSPASLVFVATDSQSSADFITRVFGQRVVTYPSVRHEAGAAAAGAGPTGSLMPAYISTDRDLAARNGEEATIEFLLLSHSWHLVHNGSGLARTVLLKQHRLLHTNTHLRPVPFRTRLRSALGGLKRRFLNDASRG